MSLQATASHTVGPYFSIGLSPLNQEEVFPADTSGERCKIEGQVIDGDGKPVTDALLEIWQANAEGQYLSGGTVDLQLPGFGRIPTDDQGMFRITTIKPGRVPGPSGHLQAPHLVAVIFMRGLLKHLFTRIYFPEERSNADDPILNKVPSERRDTLIAKRSANIPGNLEWNVVLQGKDETVFFSY